MDSKDWILAAKRVPDHNNPVLVVNHLGVVQFATWNSFRQEFSWGSWRVTVVWWTEIPPVPTTVTFPIDRLPEKDIFKISSIQSGEDPGTYGR